MSRGMFYELSVTAHEIRNFPKLGSRHPLYVFCRFNGEPRLNEIPTWLDRPNPPLHYVTFTWEFDQKQYARLKSENAPIKLQFFGGDAIPESHPLPQRNDMTWSHLSDFEKIHQSNARFGYIVLKLKYAAKTKQQQQQQGERVSRAWHPLLSSSRSQFHLKSPPEVSVSIMLTVREQSAEPREEHSVATTDRQEVEDDGGPSLQREEHNFVDGQRDDDAPVGGESESDGEEEEERRRDGGNAHQQLGEVDDAHSPLVPTEPPRPPPTTPSSPPQTSSFPIPLPPQPFLPPPAPSSSSHFPQPRHSDDSSHSPPPVTAAIQPPPASDQKTKFRFCVDLRSVRCASSAGSRSMEHKWYVQYTYAVFGEHSPIATLPIAVSPGQEKLLPHGYCVFEFTASASKVERALSAHPLNLIVCDAASGGKQVAVAKVDCSRLLAVSPTVQPSSTDSNGSTVVLGRECDEYADAFPVGGNESSPPVAHVRVILTLDQHVPSQLSPSPPSRHLSTDDKKPTAGGGDHYHQQADREIQSDRSGGGAVEWDGMYEDMAGGSGGAMIMGDSDELVGNEQFGNDTDSLESTPVSTMSLPPDAARDLLLRATPEYQALVDLEKWKQTQKATFTQNLQKKQKEFDKIQEFHNAKIKKLQENLESKMQHVEGREKQLFDFEKKLWENQKILEMECERRKVECGDVVRRVQEECVHKLSLEKSRADEAQKTINVLKQRLESSEAQYTQLLTEFQNFRKHVLDQSSIHPKSDQPEHSGEQLLKSQISQLANQNDELRKKLEKCGKSKRFYKDQFRISNQKIENLQRLLEECVRGTRGGGIAPAGVSLLSPPPVPAAPITQPVDFGTTLAKIQELLTSQPPGGGARLGAPPKEPAASPSPQKGWQELSEMKSMLQALIQKEKEAVMEGASKPSSKQEPPEGSPGMGMPSTPQKAPKVGGDTSSASMREKFRKSLGASPAKTTSVASSNQADSSAASDLTMSPEDSDVVNSDELRSSWVVKRGQFFGPGAEEQTLELQREIRRLLKEKEELLRTGVYSEDDVLVKEIDRQAESLKRKLFLST